MTSRKGEQTRQQIVEKSKELFLLNGYEKTTYRMIGKELNINPNLVSYYFGSKSILGHEVLCDYFLAEEQVVSGIISPDYSPMLVYAVQNHIHYKILADYPDVLRFYSELVLSGYLQNFIKDIPYVSAMYKRFFTYYNLPQKFPFEYYSVIESGAEIELLKIFEPQFAGERQFYECFATVFPRLIGVNEKEISECLDKAWQISQQAAIDKFHL